MNANDRKILVIGGGISGLTAAVEAAEAGSQVIITEKAPYLGGRVAQLHRYFPKLCPPTCGLEIQFRRIKENPNITFYTMAEVTQVSGTAGDFDVTIKVHPRYVNDRCVACNACAEACTEWRVNDFNFGLDKTKAAFIPFDYAFPQKYVIDKTVCSGDCAQKCMEACKYDAIDLHMKPQILTVNVGAIIMAGGWEPYDIAKADNLGFGQVANVITNMQMERLAAANGPTGGQILRPSDQQAPLKVAFVQCAGSRDENHLPYCSYICCMASLKQATYLREKNPEAEIYIFYIDIRSPGRYEQFYWKVRDDEKVHLIRGKVAKITQEPGTDNVVVVAEDTAVGDKQSMVFDMVVLAAGMVPSTKASPFPLPLSYTPDGFIIQELLPPGILAVGTLKGPLDVMKSNEDATGAALKSLIAAGRRS
ncbi:MAG: CoB--CoM heterodisulfide reductase iron-sulfur subunit A family protein [Syntrophobacterales bacterium]|nr:CoB--CoM heterodisulfide reductase iron-sulfur subunit A family protein [Syntrophobacterales bacterium]